MSLISLQNIYNFYIFVGNEKPIYVVVLIALAKAKANEVTISMKIVPLAFPYPTKLGIV